MITPNGSDRVLVDSSGWIEYFGEGPKASAFADYLENPESLLLPSIVVYEVYKKLLHERRSNLAERFLSQAFGFQEAAISFDISVAALAAKVSLEMQLPMADAIIYATASSYGARLVTSDHHFSGLPNVTVL
ncbi:MAG TPA: type II toxin-antitoxin system VapC family toxin [Candidatus Dormibacteraeota bacterium]|nr:type II toxin-antitoxin system VapC family toxin [Candidatus Dormibacteraeota bacterium]